jgi:hypothetical protein
MRNVDYFEGVSLGPWATPGTALRLQDTLRLVNTYLASPSAECESENEQMPVKIERLKPLPDAGEQAARMSSVESRVAQVEANPEYYRKEYLRRFGSVLNADNAATQANFTAANSPNALVLPRDQSCWQAADNKAHTREQT